jgi:hypothetical protein
MCPPFSSASPLEAASAVGLGRVPHGPARPGLVPGLRQPLLPFPAAVRVPLRARGLFVPLRLPGSFPTLTLAL